MDTVNQRRDTAICLTDEEAAALRLALDSVLPAMRFDAARIKLPRDRHEVVHMEETLTALRRRLG
jgi:hypothetical protein